MLNRKTPDILDSLISRNGHINLKKHHVDRTFEALQFLGKAASYQDVSLIYDRIEKEHPHDVLRLIFNVDHPGQVQIEAKHLDPLPKQIRLAPVSPPAAMSLAGVSPWHQYKWAERSEWQQLMADKPSWADDVVILNTDGSLRETSRFNVFALHRETKAIHTPPLSAGCLNGVFRRAVMEAGFILLQDNTRTESTTYSLIERDIFMKDLSQYDVWVANSVRGILPANLI